MTGVLIKRGNLHAQREDNVKRHRKKMTIYKPELQIIYKEKGPEEILSSTGAFRGNMALPKPGF